MSSAMGKPQEFEYRVAGHPGVLVVEGNEVIIKPLNQREQQFYEEASQCKGFKPYMPRYHGTMQHNASEDDTANAQEFICLENLVHGFEKPCVIDLKIGSRLYDIDATPEKQERMVQQAGRTTSGKVGLAITGMKIFGEPIADRGMCAKLTKETIVTAISQHFAVAKEWVSDAYHDYLIRQFVKKMTELLDVVQKAECRMYSSSLLFVYEASKDKYEQLFNNSDDQNICEVAVGNGENEKCSMLDMKAIDFAHSHWMPGQGPDENYIAGLQNLIEIMQSLLD